MSNELIKKSNEEISECIEAQAEYCKRKEYPHFAPNSGVCWKCNRNIYQSYEIGERKSNGYSLDRSKSELITGCPHCHRSYCD